MKKRFSYSIDVATEKEFSEVAHRLCINKSLYVESKLKELIFKEKHEEKIKDPSR